VTTRGILALGVLALLIGCSSAPEPIRPSVRDDTTFLGLATSEASTLDDGLARAELYARIASGYRELGDEQSMVSLATASLRLARDAGPTEESIRVRLSLAPLLAAAGDDAAALAALESGLSYVSSTTDSRQVSAVLLLVAQSALQSDEPARPILRRAIDEIYVIEDPEQRAETLIRIAELYQSGGPSLSVTGLIQQAIPAIRAIRAPYRRSGLFARLADLAFASNELRLGNRLIDIVLSEFRQIDAPSGDREAEHLLSVIDLLARLERIDDATLLLDLFASPYFHSRGLIVIADSIGTRAGRLDRLREAAQRTAEIQEPERLVDANLRLARGYLDAASPRAARPYADAAAGGVIANPSLYSRVELASRTAEIYVMLDEMQLVRELLLNAPDEYIRGSVAVRAANRLIDDGRLGLADDFLTIALIASDEATYLADGLRQQIVTGFARTGSIRLAIRTIERIDDELLRARSVAELAVLAEPAGLVTPIYRADLASVLASR